jgi:hypothetical protein
VTVNYVTTRWYLAQCQDCWKTLPMPFLSEEERDGWAEVHEEATLHRVRRGTNDRTRLVEVADRD